MRSERIFETLVIARQKAAVATAFLLPWSTSGLAIASGFYLLLAVLTMKRSDLLITIRSFPGATPILLFLLMLVGTLWSPDPFGPGGLSHYLKLLFIPVVMATAFTPRMALNIGYGFVAGCVFVLVLSVVSFAVQLPWKHYAPGVPFKDNAVQSGNFALCAFGLGVGAVFAWKRNQKLLSTLISLLAAVFFINVFAIYISKTGALMAIG